jgi:hypothetical protein
MMTYPPMSLGIVCLHSFVRSSHKAEASEAPLGTQGRMGKIVPASPLLFGIEKGCSLVVSEPDRSEMVYIQVLPMPSCRMTETPE